MENHSNITLDSIIEQQHFEFALDFNVRFSAQEAALLHLFDGLDFRGFREATSRSCSIDPKSMVIFIEYGAMLGDYSSRALERLSERNLFVKAILGPTASVDHTTIARFIKRNRKNFLHLFFQQVVKLAEAGELTKKTVFQDGTKMEARAGKYTFIWKSGLEKNIAKTIARLMEYMDTAKKLGLLGPNAEVTEDNVFDIAKEVIGNIDDSLFGYLPTGKGHKADPVKKLFEAIEADVIKLREQDENLSLIGDDRNSMSKTENDATFMRMKEDAMRNGQLKPAYNFQNMVDGSYIVGCTVSSDRADYDTCKPSMELLKANLPWEYENYCADGGYDSVDNFEYLEKAGIKAFIKTQDWEISKKRSYKNDISRYQNMEYVEKGDYFICANKKKLFFTGNKKKNKSGTYQKEYACKRGCKSCPLRDKCIKNKKHDYRRFSACIEHWDYRKKAYGLLTSEEGIAMRVNRSIQAEGSFANLKANMGFRRFLNFGKKAVYAEYLIHCMVLNTLTFSHRLEQGLVGTPFWYTPPKEKLA